MSQATPTGYILSFKVNIIVARLINFALPDNYLLHIDWSLWVVEMILSIIFRKWWLN